MRYLRPLDAADAPDDPNTVTSDDWGEDTFDFFSIGEITARMVETHVIAAKSVDLSDLHPVFKTCRSAVQGPQIQDTQNVVLFTSRPRKPSSSVKGSSDTA
ncbi:MAG: hypothetical protein AB8B71_20495 [Paracoccaceae bacterium]